MIDISLIEQTDPEIAEAMKSELSRQQNNIELIASENFVSPAVMAAAGSHLTNKYAEGYPAHRYYGGCKFVDVAEELARERLKRLFGCEYCNVQPHSGASAYPRVIDFKRIREICDKAGALMFVDIAHIAGLVAAGLHPSPVPYADFVTTTTHKTLRGPRGGVIMCKEQWGKAIDKAVFPGTQGGPLMHIIAAKAVAFKEALSPEFKTYQSQIVKNAAAMADEFKKSGVKMVSGGTDNHLILLNLSDKNVTGKELEKMLDEVHITVNKNAVPFDTQKPFVTSGIRVGTPAMTSRGMKENEARIIARLITKIIDEGEAAFDYVKVEVAKLCKAFPLYENCVK